jgi:hypothetical protein
LDGSTVYDVAFALVWADGDRVLNTNEAYAFASCTGCRTVSVGFQVVLVLGQANVVVPQNLAGTINYNCVECVTYALATQLVVTWSGPLNQQVDADLAALWEEISAFGESIEGVALSELQSRLTDYERRILDIIRGDPSAAPVGDSEAPADEPSASPTGSETGTPIGTGSSTGASGSTESPRSEPTDTGSPSGLETGTPSSTAAGSSTQSTTPEPTFSPSTSTSPSPPSTSTSPSATTSP